MLSIIVPCFNEKNTIEQIVNKIIQNTNSSDQILIVDDCSTDGTRDKLKTISKTFRNIKVIFNDKNLGKGGAIRAAKKYCDGDIIIIQDADLEYDPSDYQNLIQPILNKNALVVYGSRVLGKNPYSEKNFTSKFRVFGNQILTLISNLVNKQKLTDAHTCYKVFHKDVFEKINLEENGFSFCPEVTSKISKLGHEIYEVPISYNGRSYSEGKKIGLKDAFIAFKTLLKYNFK